MKTTHYTINVTGIVMFLGWLWLAVLAVTTKEPTWALMAISTSILIHAEIS